MQIVLQAFLSALQQVWVSFLHNWPFLAVSILIAAAFKLYLKPDKVSAFLQRYRHAGVLAATAAAVGTPLCSCGTTAVILGMIAGMMPWAPIITFMVASPLSSPEGLIYSAGLFGWPFAAAYFVSSILLGLAAGGIASALENRGWFRNQARFAGRVEAAVAPVPAAAATTTCACNATARPVLSLRTAPACGCGEPAAVIAMTAATGVDAVALPPLRAESCCPARPAMRDQEGFSGRLAGTMQRLQAGALLRECLQTGRMLLPMFFGFAFIGFFLNGLIPQAWVAAVFGAGNLYSVPLAATLGLPLYINSEASLPLVRALIEGGMGQGAAMAFLLCGSGTSLGAMAGALTIARWRVVALVVGILWVGAILLGFGCDALVLVGLV